MYKKFQMGLCKIEFVTRLKFPQIVSQFLKALKYLDQTFGKYQRKLFPIQRYSIAPLERRPFANPPIETIIIIIITIMT